MFDLGEKPALKRFFDEMQNNKSTALKATLKNLIINYLIASWGLEARHRNLLTTKIRKDVTQTIAGFLNSRFIKTGPDDVLIIVNAIMQQFTHDTSFLDNDIFTQRLIAHFFRLQEAVLYRSRHTNPLDDQAEITNTFLQQSSLTKPEQIQICDTALNSRQTFYLALPEHKQMMKKQFAFVILFGIAWFIFNNIVSYYMIIKRNLDHIPNSHISFIFCSMALYHIIIKINEATLQKNLGNLDVLPGEFHSFLEAKINNGTLLARQKLSTVHHAIEERNPKKNKRSQVSPEHDSSFISELFYFYQRPSKKIRKVEPISSPETPSTALVTPAKKAVPRWQYSSANINKFATYDPANPNVSRKVVELWSFKNAFPQESNYILWRANKIARMIKDKNTYNEFLKLGWIGHQVVSRFSQGYVKNKKDQIKLKIQHRLYGNCRLYFQRCAETVSDNKIKTLYEPIRFKRKAHGK